MTFSWSILSALLRCLCRGLCPPSNPTCLSFSVTPIHLWVFSPTLFSSLSAPSFFLSLSDLPVWLCVCVCVEWKPSSWWEVMKRDARAVKGRRLRMEEVSSCRFPGREAFFFSCFYFSRPTNQLLLWHHGSFSSTNCCLPAEVVRVRERECDDVLGVASWRADDDRNCFQFVCDSRFTSMNRSHDPTREHRLSGYCGNGGMCV